MRIVILTADYPVFLQEFYHDNPALAQASYAHQQTARHANLFGVADFCLQGLQAQGHLAQNIFYNNKKMQKAWADEHRLKVPLWAGNAKILSLGQRVLRKLGFSWQSDQWLETVLVQQIQNFKPDVILNQEMPTIGPRVLKKLKENCKLLVGQHAASPLPATIDYTDYDLVLSCYPPTCTFFEQQGISAIESPLAFGPVDLSIPADQSRPHDLTFVGSLHHIHQSRLQWLEAICQAYPFTKIFTADIHKIPQNTAVYRCYAGPAWGQAMYQVFGQSKITLNHHGDILPYAGNCRLYEATGMGALLMTEQFDNLGELFIPDQEIVGYNDTADCLDKIKHYLENDQARIGIAAAGQQRTLKDHTYTQRMQEVSEIFHCFLEKV